MFPLWVGAFNFWSFSSTAAVSELMSGCGGFGGLHAAMAPRHNAASSVFESRLLISGRTDARAPSRHIGAVVPLRSWLASVDGS